MFRYLYNFRSDFHLLNRSSTQLTPHSHYNIIDHIFPMLYFTSRDYFVTANSYFLIPSPFSSTPNPHLKTQNKQASSIYSYTSPQCVFVFWGFFWYGIESDTK